MRAALLAGLMLVMGCNNPCQNLCEDMATIAVDCGVTFTDAEINTCIDDFADISGDDKQTCSNYGGLEILRENWSCDDINLYRESLTP